MKINLNTFLAILGICSSVAFISASDANGQTWYDSEGRPLVVKGKKVIRKVVEVEKSEKEIVEKEKPKKDNESPIIPAMLELRPELSSVKSRRSYPIYYPYSRHHYGYPSYYRTGSYHGYQHYHQGCYRTRGAVRNNIYLNYRRSGLNIRARF